MSSMSFASTEELLRWQFDAGADEAVADTPRNWLKEAVKAPAPVPPIAQEPAVSSLTPVRSLMPQVKMMPSSEAVAAARAAADAATTLAELRAAVESFEGCNLKKTAMHTVFSDGSADAPIMLIGEAPGAEEDKQGIPFCGPSGKLLDKMFASIGLDRTQVYIGNTLFWRPPGNRQPSTEELAICEPFVQKNIALKAPRLLLLAGGVATTAILKKDTTISRLRGKMHGYINNYMPSEVPVAVLYHPSYLLRSPGQKRLAWHDLLQIREFIDSNSLI